MIREEEPMDDDFIITAYVVLDKTMLALRHGTICAPGSTTWRC
jgi:hypothetical protein